MVLHKIAENLSRREFVRSAIADQADLSIFRERPGLRVYIGLVLIALNYILGWPAVALLGLLAYVFNEELILLLGGPAIYGFSWLLLIAGGWLAGGDYSRALARWFVRIFVEKFL